MMMDNSGLSVGPQIVIDKDQVKPQDGNYSIKAQKVWLKTGSAMSTPQNPPFQVFNIPNNLQPPGLKWTNRGASFFRPKLLNNMG